MTSMAEDVSNLDLLLQASSTADAHWVEPGWPGVTVCPACTGTDCERLRLAEGFLKEAGVKGLWAIDDAEPEDDTAVRGAGGNR
jgi:hypothetical protein